MTQSLSYQIQRLKPYWLDAGVIGANFVWGRIILMHPNAPPADSFDPDSAGLVACLAAASAGDAIWMPPGTWTDSFTIPASVAMAAMTNNTIITGQVTLSSYSSIKGVTIDRTANDANPLIGIVNNATNVAWINDCAIKLAQAGAGSAIGVNVANAGETWVYGTQINAISTGGVGYGISQTAGSCYVSDDGKVHGSTQDIIGMAYKFDFADEIHLYDNAGAYTKIYPATSTGLIASVAAGGAGDIVQVPAGTITLGAPLTIPAGITLIGIDWGCIVAGTVVNNGITFNLTFSGNVTNNNDMYLTKVLVSSGKGVSMTLGSASFINGFVITSGTTTHGIYMTGGRVYNTAVGGDCKGWGIYANEVGEIIEINNSRFRGEGGGQIENATVVSNCLFWGVNNYDGFYHTTGTARVSNCTFYTDGGTGQGMDLNAAGVTLTDCNWNSVEGSQYITYGTGDRAPDNHTHDTESSLIVEDASANPSVDEVTRIAFPERNVIDLGGGSVRVRSGIDYVTYNVSNPPTKPELTAALGSPSSVDAGYMALLHDAAAGINVYLCTTDGSNWRYVALAEAVDTGAVTPVEYVDDAAITEFWQIPATHFVGTNDRTYISWIENSGLIRVRNYDHTTRGWSAVTTVRDIEAVYGDPNGRDDHNAPSILALADGTLLLFYGLHQDADAFWMHTSTNPEDESAWGAAVDIADGVAKIHNYPQPHLLPNDDIILFYRVGGASVGIEYYKTSTDDGATWSAPTKIVDFTDGVYVASYVRGNEIHLAWHTYNGTVRTDVWYAYSDDGGTTWKKRDGTAITLPMTAANSDLVFDSGANNNRVHSIVADAAGNPYIVFSYKADPNNEYRYAKWTGSEWLTYQITTSTVWYGTTVNFYTAGAAIDDRDPRRVWLCKDRTPFQLDLWETDDGGATWSLVETITAGTGTNDSFRVMRVTNYHNDLPVVWCVGEYTGSDLSGWIGYSGVKMHTHQTKGYIT